MEYLSSHANHGWLIVEWDRVHPDLLVRRMNVVCNHVKDEKEAISDQAAQNVQLDMFTDYTALAAEEDAKRAARERERKQQEVVLVHTSQTGCHRRANFYSITEGRSRVDSGRTISFQFSYGCDEHKKPPPSFASKRQIFPRRDNRWQM